MARRADREKDIDAGTAKQSRKASKSDRKHRKARIFTSDICLFYAKMNHHLELFNPFFFVLKMAFPTGARTKQGTFTSSNEAEEKHAGPGHLDVFVVCRMLPAICITQLLKCQHFWEARSLPVRRRSRSYAPSRGEVPPCFFFVERLLLLGRQDRRPIKSDEDKVGYCVSD